MSLFWKGLRGQRQRAARAVPLGLEELERRFAPASTISLAGSGAVEPMPNGTVDLVLAATRTGDLSSSVTVGYTTAATARAKTDSAAQTGTATFAPGSATAQILVPLLGEGAAANPGRTVSVRLTDVLNLGASPSFGAAVDLTPGPSPLSVVAADLNGDGKPDLVVANAGSNTVSVLMNETAAGSATPTFAPAVDFATGDGPFYVAVGDFNGDGKLDLAVSNSADNTVSVLMNETPAGSATPAFAPAVQFATGEDPTSVVVGDFNGDGRPDLAVANFNDNTVSVLMNLTAPGSATPAFAPAVNFSTGNDPYYLAVGDFNGDGKPDLAVTNTGDSTVSVLLNQTAPGSATPAFAPAVDFATGSQPFSLAVGDFNGDGKPDLAVGNAGDNTVSVLLNETVPGSATPAFVPAVDFATGGTPFSVAVADLNGDGKLDLAVANAGSNSVSVLMNETALGSATPSFASGVEFATGSQPDFVTVGDFNGDGKPDLATANFDGGTVSVLAHGTGGDTSVSSTEVSFSVPGGTSNGGGLAAYAGTTVSALQRQTAASSSAPAFVAGGNAFARFDPTPVAAADLSVGGRPALAGANDTAPRNTPATTSRATTAVESDLLSTARVANADLERGGDR